MARAEEDFNAFKTLVEQAYPDTHLRVAGSDAGGCVEWEDGPLISAVGALDMSGHMYLSRRPSPRALAALVVDSWLRDPTRAFEGDDTDEFDLANVHPDIVAFSDTVLAMCRTDHPTGWDMLFNLSIRTSCARALRDTVSSLGPSLAVAADIDLKDLRATA